MYKSIMLSNREHTSEVICSAMLKHGLEGAPEDYSLAQLLPDKGSTEFYVIICSFRFLKCWPKTKDSCFLSRCL